MGVSGSGKTTVAQRLALATGGECLDADDFHTPENKAKMSAGHPLSDEDRWPWLDLLNARLRAAATLGKPVFLGLLGPQAKISGFALAPTCLK